MKKFLSLLLSLALILSLAACGSSGSETPAAGEPSAEATAAPAASGVEEGLLRAAALYDIKTMDVAQTTDDYMVPMNIFDRLFEVEVQPDGTS